MSKCGYRISFAGGSADYPSYFKEHGPILLLGATLNKFCYVAVKPLHTFDDVKYQVFYSLAEKVSQIEDIKNNGVKGTLTFLKGKIPELNKIAIYIQNELPSQTGISSSSAMIVALLHGIYQFYGISTSKKQLAQEAIYIERDLNKESGGWQDQIFCSYGGINSLVIERDGNFIVRPLSVSEDFINELEQSCTLFYTSQRNSFNASASQDVKSADRYKKQIQLIANEMKYAFLQENIPHIGTLLQDSWLEKKKISNLISNDYFDSINARILSYGGYGSKIMGAGNGGFILCISPKEKKQQIIDELKLPHLDVGFDFKGSHIVFQE